LQHPQAATRGSLGIDLATTIDVILNDTTVHEIPSSTVGPLISQNSKIEGLLVGHSSAGVKGLLVIPRVINTDYVGQIHIMAHTLCPPLFVPKGSRIAQIVVTSNSLNHSSARTLRGNQSFDSTGPAVCFTTKMDHRPTMCVVWSQKNESVQIYAMLDTGADVTIISTVVWPEECPVGAPAAAIAGVGGHSTTMMSKYPV